MLACKAEEFLKFSKEELLEGLTESYNVIFADGVLHLSAHEIIINRIIWEIIYGINNSRFIEKKGYMPMYKAYSISEYYCNGIFASSSLSGVIEKLFEDVCLFYVEPEFDRSILDEVVFGKIEGIYNDLYNFLVCDAIEYYTSIDILDFYEIQFQQELIEAMKRVSKDVSQEAIMSGYKVLDKVISTTPELRNNPIVTGYLSGAFNKGQVYQILSSRGYLSELNSDIIPTPVISSFFLGMSSAYEMAVESRSSAKSQRSQEVAIEQSEYTARSIQLVSMRMENLVDGDCGSTDYVDYYVDPKPVIGRSVIPLLAGKWYLDEETGVEKCISKTDTHLEGKTIKLRSQSKCKHTEHNSCCLKCFGRISYSIPYLSNLGHVVASIITQIITQSLLSQKHKSDSATGLDFTLGETESDYFIKSDDNGLRLKTSSFRKDHTYELIVKQKDFIGLASSVYDKTDFSKIIPSKISKLDEFDIKVTNNKTKVYSFDKCSIAFAKSIKKKKVKDPNEKTRGSTVYGSFTSSFIKYIVGNGEERNYRLDDTGNNYIINLNNWKSDKEDIIVFPNLEFNFLDLQKDFKKGFSSSRTSKTLGKFLSGAGDVDSLTQHQFDLLNSKLDIPYSVIECLVCSFTVMDPVTNDVRLARGAFDAVKNIQDIIFYGSLGVSAAYEQHNVHFISPKSFNGSNKGTHLLDVALKPQETVNRYKRMYGDVLFRQ